MVSFSKEVLPYVIPLACILTIKENKKNFIDFKIAPIVVGLRWSSGLRRLFHLRSWMRSAVRTPAEAGFYSIFMPQFFEKRHARRRVCEDDAGSV